MIKMTKVCKLSIPIFFFFFLTNNSYAYLDPGSASIIFQAVAGILSSTLLFMGKLNSFIENFLKKRILNTFFIINLTIFPIWLFKSSFTLVNLISSFFLIFVIPFIFLFFILKNISQYTDPKNFSFFQKVLVTSIFLYGIDTNVGLWNLVNYFPLHGKSLYIFSLIFIVILWIIFFYIINKSYLKYLLVFSVFVFSYNLISQERSLNNLNSKISFDNYNENISIEKFKQKKFQTLFIVLDEMNGVGGLDQGISNYFKAKVSFENIMNNHDFRIYNNSYTTVPGTLSSIPRMLNFDITHNEPYYNDYIEDHSVYFFWKKLIKNNLFDTLDGYKIYVKQNLSIDYCTNSNVIVCDTFNPYSKKKITENKFTNVNLTEFISKFTYQNSIVSKFLSRLLVELNLAELSISPRADKAYFKEELDSLLKVIENRHFDLFFAHFLVPHKPFGFDNKCAYKSFGVLNTNPEFMKIQHNNEIYCTNLILNNFFNAMKNIKKFDNFRIILVSDHGSRNTDDPKDDFSVVSLLKYPGQSGFINYELISVQKLVSIFFNHKPLNKPSGHKYYNYNESKFDEVNF